MKVLTIVGARPQFIKAAALSQAFSSACDFEEIIIHTGQHYDHNMSQQFFKQLGIPEPHKILETNMTSSTHFIGEAITQIGKAFQEIKPDLVLVYGDTNSTLAGAIAANSASIPLAHVEAGLRSFNRNMPEEHNRIVTDHLSDFLFCPSDNAVKNLANENIVSCSSRQVLYVGDIMYDALQLFSPLGKKPKQLNFDRDFLLVTIHRPINADNQENLKRIVDWLNESVNKYDIVWPIHPRTADRIARYGLELDRRICAIEPVSYLEMLYLLKHCKAVLTDSGGLQKEAYFSDKTCFVVRDETEWGELVSEGYSILVGNGGRNLPDVTQLFAECVTDSFANFSPYGSGDTRNRILTHLRNHLSS